MQSRTVERVESWPSRSFTGGFRELHELADADFSGTVVAAGTWLFMLNGRVIGVFEGDVEDFGDADGTVYDAPHPSVPLLFAMQERDGETQAKYYTNDTPLSEADGTLTDGSFTGFIELSENVLSGDYYVVYYGGRSMSAAFVGNSEELKTGDEAFELADDEVGVYEVVKTPVNVTELPEVENDAGAGAGAAGGEDASDAAAGAAGAAAGASAAGDAGDSTDTDSTDTGSATPSGVESSSEPSDAASTGPAGRDESSNAGSGGGGGGDGSGSGSGSGDPASGAPRDAGSDSPPATQSGSSASESPSSTEASDAGGSGPTTGSGSGTESGTASGGAPAPGAAASAEEGVFDEEREWQNATSVPTIDPEDSKQPASGSSQSSQSPSKRQQNRQQKRSQSRQSSSGQSSSGQSRNQESRNSTVEKLKQAVQQREEKLSAASERIENLEGDRESLQSQIEDLERERDELQSKLDDLEGELENAGSSTPDATDVPAEEALSDTNLFVRYDSKGKATLDELGADTDPSAVNENLRIDHHTQFDASAASVEGEPFEAFLQQSVAYRFVSWAVRELPYEIRDAGHESGLKDLYDAVPQVDRAELDGTVEVETEEDGTVSRTFDVVLRDRMGNPLVVADLNTGRDPVRGDEMSGLVSDATDVRAGSDDLAAAMCVTESFFEPAALEKAEEETSNGGFLSGGDRESYVKLGRKTGYHLCLVEDRNDAFHLTVPEL